MKSTSILYVLFLVFSITSYSQIIPIHKISKNLIIDGDLSDWNIPFLGPFVVHNSGVKGTQSTFVSLSWSNENLYIAYRSKDSKIIGAYKEKDSQIYNTDDLVEIFIDPDGNGQNYVEIGVNAFSTNYDMLIECISPDCGGWKTSLGFTVLGMETVSKMTSEGFCTEIKIPFSSLESIQNGNFSKPKIGTKWNGNVFRIDYGNSTEYLALQYYRNSEFGFHQPKEFAVFEFVE
ncbi:carbohydrate-binding family 9-like protein [Flavobacterium sp. 5]|uniref:carbohydrate-binding family 9-like protein n=1 Tax=Flavobacterium sp. 5 TaxID=2035199 RepID=UPI000C2C818A|nr:carbohydrate-binding family 9-like protein [Flavobacterium sp. 5]PKB18631.1 carbohydrate binding protein with CBM9 domain [Flavobacterium sp. 5]